MKKTGIISLLLGTILTLVPITIFVYLVEWPISLETETLAKAVGPCVLSFLFGALYIGVGIAMFFRHSK